MDELAQNHSTEMKKVVIRQTMNGWIVTDDDGWMTNADIAKCYVFYSVTNMLSHLSRVWGVNLASKPDIVFESCTKKYRVRFSLNGRRTHIGRFNTRQEAEKAWKAASRNFEMPKGTLK